VSIEPAAAQNTLFSVSVKPAVAHYGLEKRQGFKIACPEELHDAKAIFLLQTYMILLKNSKAGIMVYI
jgi:hypothetical protein